MGWERLKTMSCLNAGVILKLCKACRPMESVLVDVIAVLSYYQWCFMISIISIIIIGDSLLHLIQCIVTNAMKIRSKDLRKSVLWSVYHTYNALFFLPLFPSPSQEFPALIPLPKNFCHP